MRPSSILPLFVLICTTSTVTKAQPSCYPTSRQDLNNNNNHQYNPNNHDPRYFDHNPFENETFPIDCRCILSPDLPKNIKIEIANMVIEGYYVYLCDGPRNNERDRPKMYLNSQSPTTYPHKNVSVFLGIPYAKPPLKNSHLWFKPPEPSGETLIKTKGYKPVCPQHISYLDKELVDEDCLYLNIFSPFAASRVPQPYPVMVYIHGGNWDHGSSNSFPGHMLAASQEVVVVTLNYRLGTLGFLATPDGSAHGNYGMLDQVMALKWIHEHIHAFNGDKNRVTLFGTDAGAASAGLLALSPLSKGLVKSVIAMNGAPTADWGAIKDGWFVLNTSHVLGEALGCFPHTTSGLVKCLASRSVGELKHVNIKPRVGWLPFGPYVNPLYQNPAEQFLPETPEKLIESFQPTDDFVYVSGVTKDGALPLILEDEELRSVNYRMDTIMFDKKIRQFMTMHNYSLNSEATFNALKFMYTPWSDPYNPERLRQAYINLLSDQLYKAPSDKMVKLLLKQNAKVYQYVLNYTLEGFQPHPLKGATSLSESLLVSGAPFLCGGNIECRDFYPSKLGLQFAQWTEADRNMSRLFMEAFANIAKYGEPTPSQLFNTILWEPTKLFDLKFLGIISISNQTRMETDYRQREVQFWSNYFPFLVLRETATWIPTIEPWSEEWHTYSASLWGTTVLSIIFLILAFTFCCLYMRNRKYDSY